MTFFQSCAFLVLYFLSKPGLFSSLQVLIIFLIDVLEILSDSISLDNQTVDEAAFTPVASKSLWRSALDLQRRILLFRKRNLSVRNVFLRFLLQFPFHFWRNCLPNSFWLLITLTLEFATPTVAKIFLSSIMIICSLRVIILKL